MEEMKLGHKGIYYYYSLILIKWNNFLIDILYYQLAYY